MTHRSERFKWAVALLLVLVSVAGKALAEDRAFAEKVKKGRGFTRLGTGTAGDPGDALGEPDGLNVALGLGGYITLQFEKDIWIIDGAGPDFTINALGFGGQELDNRARVFASADGRAFVAVGSIGPGGSSFPVDLSGSGLLQARFVKLVDSGQCCLSGNPTGGLDGFSIESVEALNVANDEHDALQNRPIVLGVSGANINTCNSRGTLGALLRRNGSLYLLSNNHVLADLNMGAIGSAIVQPVKTGEFVADCEDIFAADTVAHLADFVPINIDVNASNVVDAAIAAIDTSKVRIDGYVLDVGRLSNDTVEPQLGMLVKKSGMRTGLTTGVIVGTDVEFVTDYGARFVNQIAIAPGSFCREGDSGSVVVENALANPPRAVGLLFGKFKVAGIGIVCVANPIDAVLSVFGAEIVGTDDVSLPPPPPI